MLDGRLLDAFLTVAREGSFERAATVLHLTQSAVSQRVRALETRFGQTLLTRSRPCLPTGAGQTLLRYLDRIRLLEEEASRALQGEEAGPSRLRIAVNADSLHAWFPAVLSEAFADTPYLCELELDNEDYTHELLAHGEVLGCVSTRPRAMRGCEAIALGALRYLCVAAPAFARRYFPRGLDRSTLLKAPALVYDRKDKLHNAYLAQEFGIGAEAYPFHLVPSSQAFVDLARLAFGYVLVPEPTVRTLLANGELVDLAPGRPLDMPLYWHAWQIQAPGVEAVFRRIVTGARQRLRQDEDSVLGGAR
ncbi:LysR family transcriptional regulator ArgP [Chitinimonas lacunae]|uniref:LysR family transcriptional regulator ArgP n=1 Tax=Chitinimonas lacunae TaxID=1963018 RepID=A0ABV8MSH4_9NEIS